MHSTFALKPLAVIVSVWTLFVTDIMAVTEVVPQMIFKGTVGTCLDIGVKSEVKAWGRPGQRWSSRRLW